MGGGGMLRSVSRAVGTGVGGIQNAISSAKSRPTTGAFSLPSSSTSSPPLSSSIPSAVPVSATWHSLPAVRDLDDWEYFQVVEEEEAAELVDVEEAVQFASFGGLGSGLAPTQTEVEDAVSALQEVADLYSRSSSHRRDSIASNQDDGSVHTISPIHSMRHGSSSGSDSDWTEPAAMQLYHGSIAMQNNGYYRNVIDAFRLLQINPSVQRMVVSLSSDRAVWEAVMRNEAVKELKESLDRSAENKEPSNQSSKSYSAITFMEWMVKTSKEKVSEFISKIMKLVSDLFPTSEKTKMGDNAGFDLDTVIKSSFMLSVIVLLLVVVNRVQKA